MTDAVSLLLNSLANAAQVKECDLLAQVVWHQDELAKRQIYFFALKVCY